MGNAERITGSSSRLGPMASWSMALTVEQATNRRSRVVALWTDSWKSARGGYRSGEPTAARTTRTCMSITATEHIHDEVRELIRRRGIDPITDHRSTRLLI